MKGSESFDRKHVLPALLLFVVITFAPLLMSIYKGYGSVTSTFKDPSALSPLGVSIAVALCCTLLSVLLGLPGAKLLGHYRFHPKWLLRPICLLGLSTPAASLSLAYSILEAKIGFTAPLPFFNQAISLVASNIPLVILIVGSYWMTLDDAMVNSALALGVGRSRISRTVTFPYLRRSIVGSASLVFVRCLSACLSNDHIVSFILSAVAVAIMCSAFFKARTKKPIAIHKTEKPSSFLVAFGVVLYFLILTCIVLVGPVTLAYEAFSSDTGITVQTFRELFLLTSSKGSLALMALAICAIPSALIAAYIGSALSLAIRSTRFPAFISLISLPMGLGMIASGYSAIMDMVPSIPVQAFDILSFTALLTPIATIMMLPRRMAIDPDLRTTSESLGYSAGTSYRKTEGRLLAPILVASAIITIAIWAMESTPYFMSDLFAKASHAENQIKDACAFAFMMSAFSFILLLVGSRLLRKER